jgi:hypothetical protein
MIGGRLQKRHMSKWITSLESSSNMKVTNCETHIESTLNSDHFPVVANFIMKFRVNTKEKEVFNRYSGKYIWTNKEQLNNVLREYKEREGIPTFR